MVSFRMFNLTKVITLLILLNIVVLTKGLLLWVRIVFLLTMVMCSPHSNTMIMIPFLTIPLDVTVLSAALLMLCGGNTLTLPLMVVTSFNHARDTFCVLECSFGS